MEFAVLTIHPCQVVVVVHMPELTHEHDAMRYFRILRYYATTFNGVEDLGGVEAACGDIAKGHE